MALLKPEMLQLVSLLSVTLASKSKTGASERKPCAPAGVAALASSQNGNIMADFKTNEHIR
jgi:hypothetical protein